MNTCQKRNKSLLWIVTFIAIGIIAYFATHYAKSTLAVSSKIHATEQPALTAPTKALSIKATHIISHEREDNLDS